MLHILVKLFLVHVYLMFFFFILPSYQLFCLTWSQNSETWTWCSGPNTVCSHFSLNQVLNVSVFPFSLQVLFQFQYFHLIFFSFFPDSGSLISAAEGVGVAAPFSGGTAETLMVPNERLKRVRGRWGQAGRGAKKNNWWAREGEVRKTHCGEWKSWEERVDGTGVNVKEGLGWQGGRGRRPGGIGISPGDRYHNWRGEDK